MLRFMGRCLDTSAHCGVTLKHFFIPLQRPLANSVPPTDLPGMDSAKTTADMRLVGGHACLDFVNTVDARRERWGPDLLQTYADLVVWAGRVDLIEADEGRGLLAKASARPALAVAALKRAKTLREALYAALHAEAAGVIVPDDALQTIRDAVAQAMPKRSLSNVGDRLAWQWTERSNLNTISWRVAFGAAEFMVARHDRRSVRECTGPNCGWLFIDTSRGGRRRWCSDESCGTHTRVRRFRAKVDAARSAIRRN
ncbi:CGNR zinc finger domain-containing protein [Mesorhizobium kowhaii]|uniref:CGNR zinc finger domain-containing protein n=1 Tax=Mesorhizobium kowhaii TaxID=1300272 RepID=UPI00142E6E7D|nr:CGNR zinc finger domain-containing protein [Mesorhizobium kowhaii]